MVSLISFYYRISCLLHKIKYPRPGIWDQVTTWISTPENRNPEVANLARLFVWSVCQIQRNWIETDLKSFFFLHLILPGQIHLKNTVGLTYIYMIFPLEPGLCFMVASKLLGLIQWVIHSVPRHICWFQQQKRHMGLQAEIKGGFNNTSEVIRSFLVGKVTELCRSLMPFGKADKYFYLWTSCIFSKIQVFVELQ